MTGTAVGSNEDFFITEAPVLNTVARQTPADRVIHSDDVQSCLQPRLTATFSESVSNVDPSDFELTGAGSTGFGVDSISGSGASYTLTLDCVPSANLGVFRLAVVAGNDIEDADGVGLGSTTIGSNQDYEISDAPVLSSVLRDNPTAQQVAVEDIGSCTQLRFRAEFSEAVQNVDAADFAVSGEGSSGLSIDALAAVSSSVYRVTLSCLPQNARGSIRLALSGSPSIANTLNVALVSTSAATSETYLVAETRVAPSDDATVAEVVLASAEAPAVAVEKQVAHIQQRLSEQRAASPASGPADGPRTRRAVRDAAKAALDADAAGRNGGDAGRAADHLFQQHGKRQYLFCHRQQCADAGRRHHFGAAAAADAALQIGRVSGGRAH